MTAYFATPHDSNLAERGNENTCHAVTGVCEIYTPFAVDSKVGSFNLSWL